MNANGGFYSYEVFIEKYDFDTSREEFERVISSISISIVSLAQSIITATSLPVSLGSPTIAGISQIGDVTMFLSGTILFQCPVRPTYP